MTDAPGPDGLTLEAQEKRPHPLLVGLAATPLALIPVLVTLAVLTEPFFAAFSFHLLLLGLFASAYVHLRKPFARRTPVSVEVNDASLRVGDREIPREEIQRGDLLAGGASVTIRQSLLRETELDLGSHHDARALLRALDLDVSQTAARFRGMSRIQTSMVRGFLSAFAVMVPTFVLAGLAGAISVKLTPAVMLLGMLSMFVLMFAPTRIEVGGDGVLTRWLGRERFVSHAEISTVFTRVEGFGRSKRAMVVVGLTDGEVWKLPIGAPMWGGEARAEAVASRIEAARAEHERGAVAPEALLRPPGTAFAEWIKKLRAGPVVGLREAVIPRERLWRVVEDSAGDPIERAAATVALGRSLDDTERARLSRIAKRTAAPKLRVVLESATDAEEHELAEQLEELEVDAARAKKG